MVKDIKTPNPDRCLHKIQSLAFTETNSLRCALHHMDSVRPQQCAPLWSPTIVEMFARIPIKYVNFTKTANCTGWLCVDVVAI